MAFTLDAWKSKTKEQLRDLRGWMHKAGVRSVYAGLSAATLWPIIEAAQKDPLTAGAALGTVLAGVGTNLVANVIQNWKDKNSGAKQLEIAIQKDADLREELDAVIEKLEAVASAQEVLPADDREWFLSSLKDELAKLGNIQKYKARLEGSGAIAQGKGSVAVGAGATYIGNVKNYNAPGSKPQTDNNPPDDTVAMRVSYLNSIFEACRPLNLQGIDPKAADVSQKPLNLDSVYVAMMTHSSDKAMFPEAAEMAEALHREKGKRPDALSILEQLNRNQHLVILGEPGGGKSSVVNFVALCFAGELLKSKEANIALLTRPLPKSDDEEDEKKKPRKQKWDHGPLLPVRIILRDFAAKGLPAAGKSAKCDHPWDFICSELIGSVRENFCDQLKTELLEKGGIVFFDGLDEVPEAEARRVQIKQAIEDFAKVFHRCRIVVTSRTYAYQNEDWRLSKFEETVLAPFDKPQIKSFVEQWYAQVVALRKLDKDKSAADAERLKYAITTNDRLLDLARRPILLTLIASLHAWRGGKLPDKRQELYEQSVDLLLDLWERPKLQEDADGNLVPIEPGIAEFLKIDRDSLRTALNELAFEAHKAQPQLSGAADIPQKDLVDKLTNIGNRDIKQSRLIEYLTNRAGLLLSRGNKVYAFPHRTFQEYLAACRLTGLDFEEVLGPLVRSDPNRWREAAVLATAKVGAASPVALWGLVDAMMTCEHEDRFAAEGAWGALIASQALVESANLKEVSPVNRKKLNELKPLLEKAMRLQSFPAIERALAGRNLAVLGDHRPEVNTIEDMQFCFVPAGPFWMGEGENARQIDMTEPYWLAKYPVTQAQFAHFVDAGGYKHEAFWREAKAHGVWKNGAVKGFLDSDFRSNPVRFGPPYDLPNHPVVGVTWYEALAFVRWLNSSGPLSASSDWKTTLPTERQWEKAARGGLEIPKSEVVFSLRNLYKGKTTMAKNTSPKREFPWGENADANRANYDETKINATNAVGCFAGGASPYGCEEMSGNVWEWCRTKWNENENAEPDESLDGTEVRVLRGGSFISILGLVRCSARDGVYPNSMGGDFGFRVALSPFTSEL
jgi:formylglycine-generating enzyme required for sulfatase activity